MPSTFARVTALVVVMLACLPFIANSQTRAARWLDGSKPVAWNKPGLTIRAAPKIAAPVDARCREAARPPQLAEDKQVTGRGWDLVGAYHGGWEIVVIRGTAGYDGMCRPRQYQDFVFVRGVFAGTLSPEPMDSRTDGAIAQVTLQSPTRLLAEYTRFAATDALCCPSRTTIVTFDVSADAAVRPTSTFTSNAATARGGGPSASSPSSALSGTSWRLLKFEGGDGSTLKPDDPSKYTIELAAGGQLIARVDCNRGRGTWKSDGAASLQFGPMALTRAQCAPGSLHDQVVKQWGNIRSYVIRDGHLFLVLTADGGIYEFEPVSAK
jgi:heat shock protein HslJ